VGVATAAKRDTQEVTLVILWRYVQALLQAPGTLPLTSLARPLQQVTRPREVPEHPLSLLEGCPLPALESLASSLAHAIRVGAPAYNRGDAEGCARVYAQTAEQLVAERADCPGPRTALQEGLERARALEDPDDRAWSLRDTFDGLLLALERWMQARAAPPVQRPARKEYLN
jgi:serine protease Do